MTEQLRICKSCGIEKPITDFSKVKKCILRTCKQCYSDRKKQQYYSRTEEQKEKARLIGRQNMAKFRATEKGKKSRKEYLEKTKEQRAQWAKEYRERTKGVFDERVKAYRAKNREHLNKVARERGRFKEHGKKDRERLKDAYVVDLIVGKKGRHLKDEVYKKPELIELKKAHISLKREIKNHGKKHSV